MHGPNEKYIPASRSGVSSASIREHCTLEGDREGQKSCRARTDAVGGDVLRLNTKYFVNSVNKVSVLFWVN